MTSNILSGIGVGAIVTWDLQGTKVTPVDLRTILTTEGLSAESAEVPDIDARRAVKRAAQSWTKGKGNAARYRTEVVREDAVTVEIGLLRHERVSQSEVRWVQVDTLSFDIASGGWSHGGSPEALDFQAEAHERCSYLDHDYIRPMLQKKMAAWHAFGLRSQGGVYFVAGAFDTELQAVQRAVGKLGDSSLKVYHLQGTPATTAALASDAKAHAAGQMSELRAKLSDWTARAGAVRSDAVENMLDELKSLRGDVQFYADTLQVAMDDLLIDLDSCVQDARALSGAVFSDDPSAAVVRARTARTSTVEKWQAAIARGSVDEHGVVTLPQSMRQECGLSASVFQYHCVLTELNRTVFAQLGYRTRLLLDRDGVESRLLFTPCDKAAPVPVEPAADPAPVSSTIELTPAAEAVLAKRAPAPAPSTSLVYDEQALDEMPMADAVKVAKTLGIKGVARLGKGALVQKILELQSA